MAYLWENYYDQKYGQVFKEINILEKKGRYYERFTETHVQRAYKQKEITDILQEIGYRNIKVYNDFNFDENIKENAQRLFFSCVK